MPNPFTAFEAGVSELVDSHFGEETRIEPRVKGEFLAGAADPDRQAIESVVGVVDFSPTTLISQDTGKYDGLRPAVTSDKIHVSYAVSRFADTWRPRQGDTIVLTEREPRDVLSVTRVDEDRQGRLVCVCVPAGKQL